MNGARRRALWLLVGTFAAAALIAFALARQQPQPLPERQPGERPALLLLTSLPLVFGEQFSLEDARSPALRALNTRYRVVPISVADPPELARGRLLLMAQPRAQPAEDLVALDQWVRSGGRVLLLADPMLEWPSERPLGDPLRPPLMFGDTGLLAHWGLQLDAPDTRGPRLERLDDYPVMTVSAGTLSGRCETSAEGLLARCRIGKGRAVVIADADLLDAAALGSEASRNLDAVLAELARMEEQ